MFTDEIIQKLKAEHGDDLYILEACGHEVVVRAPSRPEWKRFRAAQADPAKRIDAQEQLLRGCCVAPGSGDLSALLEKRPGLAETFGIELTEIAGLAEKATSRKL